MTNFLVQHSMVHTVSLGGTELTAIWFIVKFLGTSFIVNVDRQLEISTFIVTSSLGQTVVQSIHIILSDHCTWLIYIKVDHCVHCTQHYVSQFLIHLRSLRLIGHFAIWIMHSLCTHTTDTKMRNCCLKPLLRMRRVYPYIDAVHIHAFSYCDAQSNEGLTFAITTSFSLNIKHKRYVFVL